MQRATLTASLRALELIRDDGAERLIEARMFSTAAAHTAIIDNAVRCTLDLAFAVKAAAAGDAGPARLAVAELSIDQIEVR